MLTANPPNEQPMATFCAKKPRSSIIGAAAKRGSSSGMAIALRRLFRRPGLD
jgi:hypothetical protein